MRYLCVATKYLADRIATFSVTESLVAKSPNLFVQSAKARKLLW